MKKSIFAVSLLFVCAPLFAARPVNDPTLERYVRRSVENCPGSDISLTTIDTPGPAGFTTYRATHSSNDERCGRKLYLLVSTATDTMVVGDVFSIPAGTATVEKRLADLTQKMLKKTVTITLGPAGKDGLRVANIQSASKEGPFVMHGFVDSSNKFFIVGRRGSRKVDPGETLMKELGVASGASRGAPMARIRIVEMSDLQCPSCKRAHDSFEPFLKKNLNKISYTRLDLPLFEAHDWSVKAALGARAIQQVAPAKYWEYVDFIFSQQELIQAKTIDQVVKNFCEDHDIPWAKVQPLYTSPAAKKALIGQVGKAFDNQIFSTPTFIVNGQPIFFGSTGDYVRSYIEGLLKNAK